MYLAVTEQDRGDHSHVISRRDGEVRMSMGKGLMTVIMAVMLSLGWSVPQAAAEGVVKNVFEDAFYGGLVGALLGGASLAFMDNRSDHLENIAYGGAFGVFAGVGYSIYKSNVRSFVEYDQGKMRFALPTVMPDLQDNGRGQTVLAVRADLVRGTF
jgi:hypothetical protein